MTASEPVRGGWSALWGLTRGRRSRVAILAVVSFFGALLEAGFLVLLTGTLIAVSGDRTSVGPLLGVSVAVSTSLTIAGVALVLRLAFGLAGVKLSTGIGAYIRTRQRRRLARAYLRASWDVQHNEPSGRLQELLTSFVNRVNQAVNAGTQGLTAALSLMAFLAAGIALQPMATLAVVGSLGLLLAVFGPLRRVIRRRATASAAADVDFAGAVAELGGLGLEMQTMGVTDAFVSRIDDLTRSATERQRRMQLVTQSLTPLYTFLAYAVVLAAISALVILDVGDLAATGAVMLLMLRSLSYGQRLSAVLGVLMSTMPSLNQLESSVRHYEGAPSASGSARPAQVAPLTLTDVTFSYSGAEPALHRISATIDRGEVVGVIGPSGAGKSTLAQLLLGLREPDGGTVTSSGVDVRTIDRTWWRSRVAFVPQSPAMMTGTVAENIRFARAGISDRAVRDAARSANILEDILALPGAFDCHLGPRGGRLSGGQRQRLAIARALAGHPEFLILDEPTSALDGESERLIGAALARLQGEITLVIIAHRMSTIAMCDRIMVIESGRLAAFGSHEALGRDSEFYRRVSASLVED